MVGTDRGSVSDPNLTRFHIQVPFCGSLLPIFLLFPARGHFDVAPDLILPPGDEGALSGEKRPVSIRNWREIEPVEDRLPSVLKEVLAGLRGAAYRRVLERVPTRLEVEVGSLAEMERDAEFLLPQGMEGVLRCSVPMRLPGPDHQQRVAFALLFSFKIAQPELAPEIRTVPVDPGLKWLFDAYKPPVWESGGTLLAEYVVTAQEKVAQTVAHLSALATAKRDFVEALLEAIGPALEVNRETHSQASFLVSVNKGKDTVMVHFAVPAAFPAEKPIITLQALTADAVKEKRPFFRVVDAYPYSPRWTPREMVSRITIFLTDATQLFVKALENEN